MVWIFDRASTSKRYVKVAIPDRAGFVDCSKKKKSLIAHRYFPNWVPFFELCHHHDTLLSSWHNLMTHFYEILACDSMSHIVDFPSGLAHNHDDFYQANHPVMTHFCCWWHTSMTHFCCWWHSSGWHTFMTHFWLRSRLVKSSGESPPQSHTRVGSGALARGARQALLTSRNLEIHCCIFKHNIHTRSAHTFFPNQNSEKRSFFSKFEFFMAPSASIFSGCLKNRE